MLLKENGMLFSIFVIVLYIYASVKSVKRNIVIVISSFIPMALIRMSWEYVMLQNDVKATGSWISIQAIIKLIIRRTDENKAVVLDFLKHFL